MVLLDFFKTGADKPVLEDRDEVDRLYRSKRRSVFFALVFGYSFFYVCRLTLSIAKKPMIDEGLLNSAQMGQIGFAFFLAYAFGKLTNGFLADRSNIGRFMSTGLMVSAIILVLFGFTRAFLLFAILWGVNGWFQSMGSAPSGASISQWFSNKERGTRYSIWSMAHSIGEGISIVLTAVIVAYFSWEWGFWVAGGVSILVALLMFKMLADRPRTYGLPSVADYRNDHAPESEGAKASVNHAQFEVIKNPFVWILGLSSAAMYVARYGVNSWGPMYLQEAKDYTLIAAGLVFGWAKIAETAGALSSGFISDFCFHSRRNVVTLMYGLLVIAGLVILYVGPSTHLCNLDLALTRNLHDGPVPESVRQAMREQRIELPTRAHVELATPKEDDKHVWLIRNDRWYLFWTGYCIEETPTQLKVTAKYHLSHLVGLAIFGFGLGGLLVFLGGLIAIDICSKRASGAPMGLVGMFSYLGAAVQDWVSGGLIEAGKMTVDGRTTHDFRHAFFFWLASAVVAVVLSTTLWNVKPKD